MLALRHSASVFWSQPMTMIYRHLVRLVPYMWSIQLLLMTKELYLLVSSIQHKVIAGVAINHGLLINHWNESKKLWLRELSFRCNVIARNAAKFV